MRNQRKTLPAGIVALLILAAAAAPLVPAELKLEFQAPTLENPAYLIKVKLEVSGKPFRFVGVELPAGSHAKNVLVLRNGKPADTSKNLEPGLYEIVIRHAWRAATPYAAVLQFIEDEAAGPKTIEMKGTSPASGGIPAPAEEGFSASFMIAEEAGIERKGEIVYLTVTAPKSEVENAQLAVYDGASRLPCQVVESKAAVPPESQAKTHPMTETRRIAVSVDASPGQTKLLLVFKAGPGPVLPDAYALSGEGMGKTVKSGRFALQLSPQSGQILTIEDLAAGVKLTNKAGVIHWNPDVFTPGIAWDHSFDWNPPQSFAEKSGPLLYLNARKGPMPRIKDVFLEVKYILEKDAPYFLSETRMRVDKDLGVVALRNDEMVLFKELFDTIVYKDKKGNVVKLPLKELPDKPFGLAHVAPADLDWVGLLHGGAGYGFFSLRLESSVSNLEAGGALPLRVGTYFYAPSDGDYVYWVRPWLYTWGEFATSNLLTTLPAGSMFYEKNAYLVSKWDAGTPAALDALLKRLKNPLRVF